MSKMKKVKAAVLSTVVGAMSPLAMIAPATAADVQWGGIGDQVHVDPFDGDRSDDFSNIANWIGGTVAPGATDNAVFGVNGLVQNVNVDAAVSLAKIVFSGENNATSSKSYTLSGSGVTLSGGIDAVMTGSGGDHAVNTDVTLADDATFKTSGSNSLDVGDTDTTLDLNGNDLTLDAGGGTISLLGEIDGEGNIVLENGDINFQATAKEDGDFEPTLTVTEDTVLSVNGGDVDNTRINYVIDGGTLKGESIFLGNVTMNSGTIAPGNSPGCLGVGALTFNDGTYEMEIQGSERCVEYDSIDATDDVDLGDGEVTLDILLSGYEPKVDDKFVVLDYDGSELTGEFKGWDDGDNNTIDEYTYEIDYSDNEAVTLTVLGTPSAPYTGVGSLLNSPLLTLGAAGAVLLALGATRYVQVKKTQK